MIKVREVLGFVALISLVYALGQTPFVRSGVGDFVGAMSLWCYRHFG